MTTALASVILLTPLHACLSLYPETRYCAAYSLLMMASSSVPLITSSRATCGSSCIMDGVKGPRPGAPGAAGPPILRGPGQKGGLLFPIPPDIVGLYV